MSITALQSLKKIGQSISSLQSKKMSKEQFNNIMNTYHQLVSLDDMTAQGNWSLSGGSVYLLGPNRIRPYVYGKRSSDTGSGNITDEVICTFTIDDERITYIPSYWAALNYVSGTISTGLFRCSSTSNPWECKVYITATHAATSYGRYIFDIPVLIDVTKF